MSPNVQKSTAGIDFGVTNKFHQAGKFTNIEPMSNEAPLYLYRYISKDIVTDIYRYQHKHTQT